ncbi:MAG: amidohydrolase [Balneolaceae bacterium]|nr:amidohydrolase [Balneolaceae bacterium]
MTNKDKTADLILTDASIWTANDQQPRAEAMAVKNDKILAVGNSERILRYRDEKSEIVELEGRFICPGFIDAHIHLIAGGFQLQSVDLRDAEAPPEFENRIADFARKSEPGRWILGGGWDGSDWESLPRKEWIDDVTQDNPVFVRRQDMHMGLANSLALEKAGIDKEIGDPEGGTILRDASGEPTGILKDNAMKLVQECIPPFTDEEMDGALDAAMQYLSSNGVTSVHQMWYSEDPDRHRACFERAKKENRLNARIYQMYPLEEWERLKEVTEAQGRGDHWVKVGGLKSFVDGSLGSRTALFNDPYIDQPGQSGLLVNEPAELKDWIRNADRAGLQVTVHAIGDKANRLLLNIYKKVFTENGPRDRRFRIEHAQHLLREDIPRFAELNVIPSMQPWHMIDDGRWMGKALDADRLKMAYAFRSLADSGATLVFGSDWYVAPADPLGGIFASVTRMTLDGKNPEGWIPEQKITVEQALRAYTKNAAYASFDEEIKGSLEPGKLADFVVISNDPTRVKPAEIRNIQVERTYVGGKLVFKAKEL